MASRVRLLGVFCEKSSPNSAPLKHSNNNNVQADAGTFAGSFKATRMWNEALKRFRNGMPLKRHRKMMFTYEDSFSGREAVDFLMIELPKFYSDNREVTRSNCHMLLERFMSVELFACVRKSNDKENVVFRESDVYRFSDIPIERLASTPVLAKRTSFKEQGSPSTGSSGTESPKRFQKSNKVGPRKEHVRSASPVLSFFRSSKLAKTRRLSASHGDLQFATSSNIFESSVAVNSSVAKTVSEKEGRKKVLHHEKRSEDKENRNPLDEVIEELRKVAETSTANLAPTFRTFGKTLYCATSEEEKFSEQPETRKKATHASRPRISPIIVKRGLQSEGNINAIWKEAVLKRLTKVLHVDSLKGIVDHSFSGEDVKWNCENIDSKGVVKVRNENDDISSHMVWLIRYVAKWPYSQADVSAAVYYEGFEKNAFRTICELFSRHQPILPASVGSAILRIVRLLEKRNKETRKEGDIFSEDTSERRRELVRDMKGSSSSSQLKSPSNGVGKFTRNLRSRCSMSTLNPWNSSRKQDDRSAGTGNSSSIVKSPLKQAVFSRKQSTSRSSELQLGFGPAQKLEDPFPLTNLAKDLSHLSCAEAPRDTRNVLMEKVAQKDEAVLNEAVSLVLLTLPPQVRRRLHCLLRFMDRVSRNYCLFLDPKYENRYVVLSRLEDCVIYPSGSLTTVQCMHLVVFLMDHQDKIFAIPHDLGSEVEKIHTACNSEKKRDSGLSGHTEESSEDARESSERCLLNVIDNIVENDFLSVDERTKELQRVQQNVSSHISNALSCLNFKDQKPKAF